MNTFIHNLSLVLAHSAVYESTREVPEGVVNDFVNGFGFGMDILAGLAEGKPTIPDFKPIDVGTEQQKATTANLNALPGLEDLASKSNQFSLDQIEKMMSQVIPGYDAIKGGVSKNIQDMISGQIPTDVSAAVQNSAAARAIGGGFAGSGTARNLVARDLGLTSLDLTQKGLSAAQSWLTTMNNINAPGQFNIQSMFITPQFQTAVDTEERNAQFQHDYVSNLNDWQHSFGSMVGQDIRDTGNTIGQLLSSYLGGMGGGMGGGGGGGFKPTDAGGS